MASPKFDHPWIEDRVSQEKNYARHTRPLNRPPGATLWSFDKGGLISECFLTLASSSKNVPNHYYQYILYWRIVLAGKIFGKFFLR